MLPELGDDLTVDFTVEEQSDKTYRLDPVTNTITGYIDGLEAVKQAIYLILSTERFVHEIYSWNYGSELSDLIGEPLPLVYSKIQDNIADALIQDDRILRSALNASFTSNRGSFLLDREICEDALRIPDFYEQWECGS